jgi:DNA-binding transcriptional LysR family regulator
LERGLIDLAIRYCKPEPVPEGAVRLFGDEMVPVCCHALFRNKARLDGSAVREARQSPALRNSALAMVRSRAGD